NCQDSVSHLISTSDQSSRVAGARRCPTGGEARRVSMLYFSLSVAQLPASAKSRALFSLSLAASATSSTLENCLTAASQSFGVANRIPLMSATSADMVL